MDWTQMAEALSRKALYEAIWSEPMKTLAARFGISDVALKKTCAKAAIPVPPRGHWAKKQAGKRTVQIALPARPPGMEDEVIVGAGRDRWFGIRRQQNLSEPLPPPPVFPEALESVRARITSAIGKVGAPRTVRAWHPVCNRLLKEDERRLEKQRTSPYPYSWDQPLFASPFERRRLRILNGLFLAVARMNGRPEIRGHEARDISITFHRRAVSIALDRVKQKGPQNRRAPDKKADKHTSLRLSILEAFGSDKERMSWQDDENTLESKLTEIATEVVLTAERKVREDADYQYRWRIKEKARLEEEDRRRRVEAERAERERRAKLEQARLDRLAKDAAALRQASDIRNYVEAVIKAVQVDGVEVGPLELTRWADWAKAHADRLDPVRSGAFLDSMRDVED